MGTESFSLINEAFWVVIRAKRITLTNFFQLRFEQQELLESLEHRTSVPRRHCCSHFNSLLKHLHNPLDTLSKAPCYILLWRSTINIQNNSLHLHL